MATLNRTFSVKNGIDVANTIIVDANRNLSNIAEVNANSFITVAGLNVTDQANTARNTANDAYGQANNAYAAANARVLKSGDTMTGNLNVAATLITQNIIPNLDVTYNLGSTDNRFKDLYLSNSTIYLGDTTLSAVGDEIVANTFNAAVSFVSGGLNVLDQANTARDVANTAYGQANDAFSQANTARSTANDAYASSNTVSGVANAAYAQANTARSTANASANTVRVSANGGSTLSGKQLNFVNTTTAIITVSDAFDGNANIAIDVIGGGAIGQAYDQANTARDTANAAYAQANTARDTANDAYGQANTGYAQANAAYTQANTARNTANDAYAQANTARDTANDAYGQANTGYAQANAAYAQANTARDTANDAYGQANTARTTANDAYAQANTARNTANDAYGQANSAYGQANSAYGQANAAYDQANAAYAEANSKLDLSGGTVVGDVTISGNLFVNGAQTVVNTESLTINDPIFLLANNNTTNSVGLGFTAHYGPTQQHTGLIRAHQDNNWYLFEDYDEHILYANNVLDTGNIKLATLKANISANSILLVGNTVATQANLTIAHNQANSAYAQANTARDTANDAYGQANTARNTANDSYAQANTARDTANAAYAQANTARDTANDAYAQANTGYAQANAAYAQANTGYAQANAAYAQANTARDTANDAYAQANTARNTANDAYAQANTGYAQANAAYGQANAAYDQANAAYTQANTKVSKSGDTMTGGLVINTAGYGLSVGNANVAYTLTVGSLNVTTNTVTTSSPGQVVLDKFPATQLASAKYFVQANSSSDYHTTEVVLVQDATNVWLTEYGSIQTGPSLGSFSADISSGDVRLLFNAVNDVNTIRSVRYGIVP